MSHYTEKTLMHGEKIRISCQPHKIIFVWAFTLIIAAILVALFGPLLSPLRIVLMHRITIANLLGIIIFVFGIFQFIQTLIIYKTSEYIVTNKRVIMKTGLLSINVLEILLTRMEAIHVSQTLAARFYNYGCIVLIGVGGTQDYFSYVPNPLLFRKYIQEMQVGQNDEKS